MTISPERISAAYAVALDACDGDPERARKFLLAGMELAALKARAATPLPGDDAALRTLHPSLREYVRAS